MKHSLLSTFVFVCSVAVSVLFQNCGDSSIRAAESTGEELTVDIIPEQGNNTPNDFSFNLNQGDSVVYNLGSSESSEQSVSRIYGQRFYTIKESILFERSGTVFNPDLHESYCENSALPHCTHLNTITCLGSDCPPLPKPIRCHWQKRMSVSEVQTTFDSLNNISFMTRSASENDPFVPDCNTPLLSFVGLDKNLTASLADRSCVPPGDFYVSAGVRPILSLFNNEFEQVNERGELCNRYSTYHWSTSSFIYSAQSSDSTAETNRQIRTINYENQVASLLFKNAGETRFYCANVVMTTDELSVFFPTQDGGGLQYFIVRPQNSQIDVDTHEIIYSSPIDGGAHWKFYMNELAAEAVSGGAVLSSPQAAAIESLVQSWVDRVLSSSNNHNCPEPIEI